MYVSSLLHGLSVLDDTHGKILLSRKIRVGHPTASSLYIYYIYVYMNEYEQESKFNVVKVKLEEHDSDSYEHTPSTHITHSPQMCSRQGIE